MKRNSLLPVLLLLLLSLIFSIHAREVMSWVPPYDISRCYSRLTEDMGTYSAHDVMTHLGLQFWRPLSSGEIVYEEECDDEAVNKFREKCTEYGIKLLLCIYNNNQQNPGWDWPLARTVIRDKKTAFINALYNECKRLNLDGVDIDLEGTRNYDDDIDRPLYAAFVKELGEKLHAEGLVLTADSFHSPCYNAPNMAWWEDWAGYVDHIHSMGYAQLYENNNKTLDGCPAAPDKEGEKFFKYSYQSQFALDAGLAPQVASIGMPSSSTWGGQYLRDHIRDILDLNSPTSVCIWDFTLGGSQWRESETWELLKKLVDMDTGQTDITIAQPKAQIKKFATVSLLKDNIQLTVKQAGQYTIALFDASGRLFRSVSKKEYNCGLHSLPLSGGTIANGICFITIKGDKQSLSQKVLLHE